MTHYNDSLTEKQSFTQSQMLPVSSLLTDESLKCVQKTFELISQRKKSVELIPNIFSSLNQKRNREKYAN